MLCSIYKSRRKSGTYLYIPEKDDFSQLPDTLMQMFGKPEFVMVLNLDGRTLAQADVEKVKQSMQNEGFYLQLPPPPENLLNQYKAQEDNLK